MLEEEESFLEEEATKSTEKSTSNEIIVKMWKSIENSGLLEENVQEESEDTESKSKLSEQKKYHGQEDGFTLKNFGDNNSLERELVGTMIKLLN